MAPQDACRKGCGEVPSAPHGTNAHPHTLHHFPAWPGRYVQAELMNGRTAMLAVAGIIFPELLSNLGLSWPGAGVAWYDAGKFEYFAPASSLFGVQMLLFAWVEIRRCAGEGVVCVLAGRGDGQLPMLQGERHPDQHGCAQGTMAQRGAHMRGDAACCCGCPLCGGPITPCLPSAAKAVQQWAACHALRGT